MSRINKLLSFSVLAILVASASLILTSVGAPAKVHAAVNGSCEYRFGAVGVDANSKETKPCSTYAEKFGSVALDATSRQKCYNVTTKVSARQSSTVIEARDCGGDAAGYCTYKVTDQTAGSNTTTTKKACNSLVGEFKSAANTAAAAGTCYFLTETAPASGANQYVLAASACGSPENNAVGGTAFDNGGSNGGTVPSEADAAFGGCPNGKSRESGCGIVEKYLNPLINLLSAAVGMIVIIMIIVGGIQYASAGGDAGKVAAAKSRIFNAIFALIVFLFLYAILQWLVPGGAF